MPSVEIIGEYALAAYNIAEITVAAGNAHFEGEEGILYSKGKTELVCYPTAKEGTAYLLPSAVEKNIELCLLLQRKTD